MKAKRITKEEVKAIFDALPQKSEFTGQTICALARAIAPRLSAHQVEGLPSLLKSRLLITNTKNLWHYKKAAPEIATKTPDLPSIAPQDIFAPIAPTLRQDCAEKTYTKAQVIEAFKSFYVREYARMSDQAYTLAGMLESAL